MEFPVTKVRFALIGKKREILRAAAANLRKIRNYDCFLQPSVPVETLNEAMLALMHARTDLLSVMQSCFSLSSMWQRPFLDLDADEQRAVLYAETVSAMFQPSARPIPSIATWACVARFVESWNRWQRKYATTVGTLIGRLISESLSQYQGAAIYHLERALCVAPGMFDTAADSGMALARMLSNLQKVYGT